MGHEKAAPLFQGLSGTNFQSIYASRYPSEDWAEALALWIAHSKFRFQYEVTADGQSFDLTQHWNSPKLAPKRSYVESFLAGPFKYPGMP